MLERRIGGIVVLDSYLLGLRYHNILGTLGTGGMHVSEIIIMIQIVVCAISAMKRVAKRSCMVDGSRSEQGDERERSSQASEKKRQAVRVRHGETKSLRIAS